MHLEQGGGVGLRDKGFAVGVVVDDLCVELLTPGRESFQRDPGVGSDLIFTITGP